MTTYNSSRRVIHKEEVMMEEEGAGRLYLKNITDYMLRRGTTKNTHTC